MRAEADALWNGAVRQRDLYRGQNTERWIQMPVPSLVDRYYPPCLFFSKQKKQQQRKRKKLYNAFPFVFPKAFVFDHKRCINVSYISRQKRSNNANQHSLLHFHECNNRTAKEWPCHDGKISLFSHFTSFEMFSNSLGRKHLSRVLNSFGIQQCVRKKRWSG